MASMTILSRTLQSHVLSALQEYPLVILRGPKGAGKSVLADLTVEGSIVSMADLEAREMALSDPESFLMSNIPSEGVLVVDDIEEAPNFLPHLLEWSKRNGHSGQFLVISSMPLMDSVPDDLAIELRLFPFSQTEFSPKQLLEEQLFSGCYPDVTLELSDPAIYYAERVNEFIERDLPKQIRVSRLVPFIRFLRLCAGSIGQVLNQSTLGDNCGVTHNTARTWLRVLEDNGIAFLLPPAKEGYGKRLVRTPKLYFYDTGLACWLLGIKSPSQLTSHYLRGGLFESYVLSELMKQKSHEGHELEFSFWRDKLGNEIDCLIDDDKTLRPLEIKAGRAVSMDYFTQLNRWNTLSDSAPEDAIIIYAGDEDHSHPMGQIHSWRNLHTICSATTELPN